MRVLSNIVLSKWEFYMVFRTFPWFSNLIQILQSMFYKCLSTQSCDAVHFKWFMQSPGVIRFKWKHFCLVTLEQALTTQIYFIPVENMYFILRPYLRHGASVFEYVVIFGSNVLTFPFLKKIWSFVTVTE